MNNHPAPTTTAHRPETTPPNTTTPPNHSTEATSPTPIEETSPDHRTTVNAANSANRASSTETNGTTAIDVASPDHGVAVDAASPANGSTEANGATPAEDAGLDHRAAVIAASPAHGASPDDSTETNGPVPVEDTNPDHRITVDATRPASGDSTKANGATPAEDAGLDHRAAVNAASPAHGASPDSSATAIDVASPDHRVAVDAASPVSGASPDKSSVDDRATRVDSTSPADAIAADVISPVGSTSGVDGVGLDDAGTPVGASPADSASTVTPARPADTAAPPGPTAVADGSNSPPAVAASADGGNPPDDRAPVDKATSDAGRAPDSNGSAGRTTQGGNATSANASPCTTPADVGADEGLLARAYLLRVAEPPAPYLARFVAEQGPVAAAERIRNGTAPGAVLEETAARRDLRLAEQDLAAAAAVGARLLTPEDPEWPAWPFVALNVAQSRGAPWAGPPLALWVRGTADLAACTERAVAVVGARSASAYGEHVAAELGHGLATEGITVVSGAAYGIDGAAHRGALTAEGPTVAVLGCGIDKPYPAGHAMLLDRIAESGAVVSEYPPGTPPAKHRFLVRNRLIAALAAGVVVVEAGRRSGTRNTAATAAALGRLVMAVPGPVSSAMSVGCHDLLRTADACLVTSVADIAESVGRIGVDLAPRPETNDRRATDGLDDRSLRVHEALSRRAGLSAEQIAVRSGVPLERVRAVLPALELMGLADRCESGWRSKPTQT